MIAHCLFYSLLAVGGSAPGVGPHNGLLILLVLGRSHEIDSGGCVSYGFAAGPCAGSQIAERHWTDFGSGSGSDRRRGGGRHGAIDSRALEADSRVHHGERRLLHLHRPGAGAYSIRITQRGFKTQEQRGIIVAAPGTRRPARHPPGDRRRHAPRWKWRPTPCTWPPTAPTVRSPSTCSRSWTPRPAAATRSTSS